MHLLPAERTALRQTSLATRGLAQDGGAALADNDGLGVREDGGDGEAAGALDVHEEGSGNRHQGLVGRHVSTCAAIEVTASSSIAVALGCTGRRTLSLCFLASAAGLGLRRSTARTCGGECC